jgi:hypothetical protein
MKRKVQIIKYKVIIIVRCEGKHHISVTFSNGFSFKSFAIETSEQTICTRPTDDGNRFSGKSQAAME